MPLIVSLSGGKIVTGDPVNATNSFSVPSIFTLIVICFLRSAICFTSVVIFINLSVWLFSVSSGPAFS